jgi:tetratricopeptide (TPR) repeat protein
MNRFKIAVTGFITLLVATAGSSVLDDANALYSKGKAVEALPLYKKALKQGENPAVCTFNLGNVYFQLDSVPQSIIYYQATVRYAPDFFRGHLNLAIAYYTLEEIGECIASLKRALTLEPADEKAQLILAASYRKLKAYPEAITLFEQIIEQFPQKEEPYLALAEIYRDLEDNSAAICWLTQYPEGGGNQSYVYLLLADIYEKQGNFNSALYYLKQAFELDKTNNWTWYRIVTLHEKNGNDLLALEEAQRGLEQFPEFPELALLAGNLAFKTEQFHEAEWFYTIAGNKGSAGGIVGLENIRLIRMKESF